MFRTLEVLAKRRGRRKARKQWKGWRVLKAFLLWPRSNLAFFPLLVDDDQKTNSLLTCRGAKTENFIREMKEIQKVQKPSIIFLIEPKISGYEADILYSRLGKVGSF